jgi:hypothetical protein
MTTPLPLTTPLPPQVSTPGLLFSPTPGPGARAATALSPFPPNAASSLFFPDSFSSSTESPALHRAGREAYLMGHHGAPHLASREGQSESPEPILSSAAHYDNFIQPYAPDDDDEEEDDDEDDEDDDESSESVGPSGARPPSM